MPIYLERELNDFDLFNKIINNKDKITFRDGDLLIISSKYLSISEGRVKKLKSVKPSMQSKKLSKLYRINPEFMELIIRESDQIFGGLYGFVLTSIHGILAPNAGIDRSNVPRGYVVLYPKDPYGSIDKLRKRFFVHLGLRIGIILSDSRILPMRKGTVGVALASTGFEPVIDLKGTKDLFDNVLKYTSQNIADGFASLGTMIMGESNRSTPVILIRDAEITITDKVASYRTLGIEGKFDIYIRGLGEGKINWKNLKI
ncbi:MAG: coenzyme F420-0:L-glutamate ligase [Thermoproteota archaeon]|nr:coenzyme F420-0:L-glutamate ligase [Thermoproteota archaeon]